MRTPVLKLFPLSSPIFLERIQNYKSSIGAVAKVIGVTYSLKLDLVELVLSKFQLRKILTRKILLMILNFMMQTIFLVLPSLPEKDLRFLWVALSQINILKEL